MLLLINTWASLARVVSLCLLGVLCLILVVFWCFKILIRTLYRGRLKPMALLTEFLLHPLMYKGFETHIDFPNSVVASSIQCDQKSKTIGVDYIIPKSICDFDSSTGKYNASLGGLLAVADQLTSVAIMVFDKTHRIGVSVKLFGEFLVCSRDLDTLGLLQAGQTIRLQAQAIKLGKTLGFSSMKVLVNGRAIAECRHIKFLHMGFIWDMLGDVIPILTGVWNHWKYGQNRRYKLNDSNMSQAIELTSVQGSNGNENSLLALLSRPAIQNPFGSLHGGALAIASFQAAMRFTCYPTSSSVRSLSIEYLSPCKGQLFFELHHNQTCHPVSNRITDPSKHEELEDRSIGEISQTTSTSSTSISSQSLPHVLHMQVLGKARAKKSRMKAEQQHEMDIKALITVNQIA